jgi:hypothetical protein
MMKVGQSAKKRRNPTAERIARPIWPKPQYLPFHLSEARMTELIMNDDRRMMNDDSKMKVESSAK